MAGPKIRKRRRASVATMLRRKMVEAIVCDNFHEALVCAEQLYKHERSAEHRRYLIKATIKRAAELSSAGELVRAIAILGSVAKEEFESEEALRDFVRELVRAGDWRTVDDLISRITDCGMRYRLEGLRADLAVLFAGHVRANLPQDIRLDASRIFRVLTEFDYTNNEEMRKAVEEIPESSLLKEWKILVKALELFCAGDGSMAANLFRQLEVSRVPASLAIPLRSEVDPTFSAPEQAGDGVFELEFERRLYRAVTRKLTQVQSEVVLIDILIDLYDTVSWFERQVSDVGTSSVAALLTWRQIWKGQAGLNVFSRLRDSFTKRTDSASEQDKRMMLIEDTTVLGEQLQTLLDHDAQLCRRKLERILGTYGVEPFTSIGEQVNNEYMEVVERIDADGRPSAIVTSEIRPGFRRYGKPYRAARVVATR